MKRNTALMIVAATGVFTGTAGMALPLPVAEWIAGSLGLSELVPQAAPPLGSNFQLLLGAAFAVLGIGGAAALLPWEARVSVDRYASGRPVKGGHREQMERGESMISVAFSKLVRFARGLGAEGTEQVLSRLRSDEHVEGPRVSPLVASRDLAQLGATPFAPEPPYPPEQYSAPQMFQPASAPPAEFASPQFAPSASAGPAPFHQPQAPQADVAPAPVEQLGLPPFVTPQLAPPPFAAPTPALATTPIPEVAATPDIPQAAHFGPQGGETEASMRWLDFTSVPSAPAPLPQEAVQQELAGRQSAAAPVPPPVDIPATASVAAPFLSPAPTTQSAPVEAASTLDALSIDELTARLESAVHRRTSVPADVAFSPTPSFAPPPAVAPPAAAPLDVAAQPVAPPPVAVAPQPVAAPLIAPAAQIVPPPLAPVAEVAPEPVVPSTPAPHDAVNDADAALEAALATLRGLTSRAG